MSFVQILECSTSRAEEMKALDAEWQKATEGRRTLRRQIVTTDRDAPGRYVAIFFFDSYESAQENSNLPETREGWERYSALLDGPATFLDLDVIEDRVLGYGGSPGFVQVIDIRTSRVEEMQSIDREYGESVSDRTTVRRSVVTQDRGDPARFLVLVFFDSYDAAMENSNLPETSAMAEKMGAVLDAPPSFRNLDVIEDSTL